MTRPPQDERIADYARLQARLAELEDELAEHRRAAVVMQENMERYRTLFENAPLGYQSLDENGDFLEVNQTWCDILGYDREEVLGRNFSEFVHPDFRESFAENFPRFKSLGYILGVEFEMVRKDGTVVVVAGDGKIGRTADGAFKQTHCTLQDVTDRKRAEEERQDLERQMLHAQKLESLGLLAGGIAHDFNNLLMGILGNADLALMDMRPESPARESVEAVTVAAKRAADLAKQMLAYSGKGRFVIQSLDLQALVEEMIHLLEVSISKKAVLRYDFGEGVPPVEGDATQLRQIVVNLVINASEAIGDGNGVIAVRTGSMRCDRDFFAETLLDDDLPEGLYAFVEVSDTGCGMDAETLGKIFDPFFSTKFTGRGLGLAAVLGIVRGHKGNIRVYSEPGKGTTFKVLLPATDRAAAADEAPEPPASLAVFEGKTVLLVDDEPQVRSVGRRMFERLGMDVMTASDGRQALEIFDEDAGEIDCIVLDLTMPGLDGEQTFRELRRRDKVVPIVLSSGYNEQDLIATFAAKGLAGFIQKPYRLSVLRETLGRVFPPDDAPST